MQRELHVSSLVLEIQGKLGWVRKTLGLPWGLLADHSCGKEASGHSSSLRKASMWAHTGHEGPRGGKEGTPSCPTRRLSYFCLSLNLQRGARCAFNEVFARTLWEPCYNYLTFASWCETHLESEVSSQEEELCSRHRLDSHLRVLRGKTTSSLSPSLECIARSFFQSIVLGYPPTTASLDSRNRFKTQTFTKC